MLNHLVSVNSHDLYIVIAVKKHKNGPERALFLGGGKNARIESEKILLVHYCRTNYTNWVKLFCEIIKIGILNVILFMRALIPLETHYKYQGLKISERSRNVLTYHIN